jgi:hypothetical protein
MLPLLKQNAFHKISPSSHESFPEKEISGLTAVMVRVQKHKPAVNAPAGEDSCLIGKRPSVGQSTTYTHQGWLWLPGCPGGSLTLRCHKTTTTKKPHHSIQPETPEPLRGKNCKNALKVFV